MEAFTGGNPSFSISATHAAETLVNAIAIMQDKLDILKDMERDVRENVHQSREQITEVISELDSEVQQLKRNFEERSVTREELEILKNRIALLESREQQPMQATKQINQPFQPPRAISRRSEYTRPGVSYRRQSSSEKKDMQKRLSLPAMFTAEDYMSAVTNLEADIVRKRLPSSMSSNDSGRSSLLTTPDECQKSFEFFPKLKRSRSATTRSSMMTSHTDKGDDGDLV